MSYAQILKDPSVSYISLKGLGHSVDLPEMTGTIEWLSTRLPKD